MSDNSHDTGVKSKKKSWSGYVFTAIPVLVAFVVIGLLFRGCSESRSTNGGTSSAGTSASSTRTGGTSSTTNVVHYNLEVPKGLTLHMPSKDSEEWSDPAPGHAGFQLMRDADRGRGSYDTQHQKPNSDEWFDGISFDETNERYRSKGDAQDITISYLPYDPANPRR